MAKAIKYTNTYKERLLNFSRIYWTETSKRFGYVSIGYNSIGHIGFGYNGILYNGFGYIGIGYNGIGYNGIGYIDIGYNGIGNIVIGYNGIAYNGIGYNGKGYNVQWAFSKHSFNQILRISIPAIVLNLVQNI